MLSSATALSNHQFDLRETTMSHEHLDSQIQTLSAYTEGGASGKRRWNEVWDLIKQIGPSFKGTRYPTREENDRAWEKFQGLVGQVKEAQERQRAVSESQAAA